MVAHSVEYWLPLVLLVVITFSALLWRKEIAEAVKKKKREIKDISMFVGVIALGWICVFCTFGFRSYPVPTGTPIPTKIGRAHV